MYIGIISMKTKQNIALFVYYLPV